MLARSVALMCSLRTAQIQNWAINQPPFLNSLKSGLLRSNIEVGARLNSRPHAHNITVSSFESSSIWLGRFVSEHNNWMLAYSLGSTVAWEDGMNVDMSRIVIENAAPIMWPISFRVSCLSSTFKSSNRLSSFLISRFDERWSITFVYFLFPAWLIIHWWNWLFDNRERHPSSPIRRPIMYHCILWYLSCSTHLFFALETRRIAA